MVAGIWVLIILFAIYFFIEYLIPFLKSREPIIRKDCVHCEKDDIGVLGCILFKYKLDKNFNCDGCKKYKSK